MQWWCAAQGIAWEWTWRPYPGVWAFVAVLAALWSRGFRRARRRARVGKPGPRASGRGAGRPSPGPEPSGTHAALFGGGLLVLWAALDWPIGTLGAGYLASVHMVQFLLIALVAPPLLLLGVAPLLSPDGRVWRRPLVRFVSHPLVALSLFTAILGATHWPAVVDGLMASQLGSFALDMAWLGAGVVFWWPVVMDVPERPWLGAPLRMGHLVAGTLLNTGVFAYLTFSDLPVYATYELAPPVHGLSTRDDQLLAGLLMKMGGALVLWTAVTILFFRWFARQEAEEGREPVLPADP